MNVSDLKNENKFLQSLNDEKIKTSRTMCVLGSLLYLAFAIVDLVSLSATLTEVLLIRGAVVMVLMGTFFITSYKFFLKYYDFAVGLVYVVSAVGIEAMIYLALPGDHASHVYFAGLLLVIMTIFAWSYFKLRTSVIVTLIVVASYFLVEMVRNTGVIESIVNVFFLFSAACIGFVSQLIRDRFVSENFLLQQSLAEALEQKTKEAKSQTYLANHDPLTDLPNRRYMMEQLEETLQYAKENNRILLIMYMDLNGFKQVNDIYGHSAGDEVLVIVAKRLELAVRKGDLISRLGGDEYLMGLLMNKDNLDEVEGMIEKFITLIEQPMNIDGLRLKIGASIGIAAYPMHGNQVEVLVDIADKKMYGAKKDGRVMPVNLADTLKEKDKNTITISPTTGSTSL